MFEQPQSISINTDQNVLPPSKDAMAELRTRYSQTASLLAEMNQLCMRQMQDIARLTEQNERLEKAMEKVSAHANRVNEVNDKLALELSEVKAQLEEAKLACGEFIKPPFADSIPCAIQCISNRCFIAEQSLKNREQANADLREQLKDMTDQFFAVSQENALLRDKPGSASCLAAANERDSLRAKLAAAEQERDALCDDLAKIGTLLGVETGERDSASVLNAAQELRENGNYAYALEMVKAANGKRQQLEQQLAAAEQENEYIHDLLSAFEWQRINLLSVDEVEKELLAEGYTKEKLAESFAKIRATVEAAMKKANP